jgi:hypothetical protein
LLDDVEGVERIYPAKIFELMYLGRPVLTLSPAGALARLVAGHELGDLLAPRDEEAIAALLEQKLRAFRASQSNGHPYEARLVARGIDRFHRKALAGEFAAVMRGAVERRA